jgi:hypothetical protein
VESGKENNFMVLSAFPNYLREKRGMGNGRKNIYPATGIQRKKEGKQEQK